jgi:hypothetical protein
MDKRMDEWVPVENCHLIANEEPPPRNLKRKGRKTKRAATEAPATTQVVSPAFTTRGASVAMSGMNGSAASQEIVMTEEDFDIQHHKQITAHRNFDRVYFGDWQIKTW